MNKKIKLIMLLPIGLSFCANAQGIFYKDANFNGDSITIKESSSDVRHYNQNFNDVISSLKLTEGYKARLYEHINYEGRSIQVDRDSTFLSSFNDIISSIGITPPWTLNNDLNCPQNSRLLTKEEASHVKNELLDELSYWGIAKLAGNYKISGRGYGGAIEAVQQNSSIGESFCVEDEGGSSQEVSGKTQFDPSLHEIVDIRVNEFNREPSLIYANGKMQSQVVVEMQIHDAVGNPVVITGDEREFVTLFLGNLIAGSPNSTISIDGYHSYSDNRNWKATENRNKYDLFIKNYRYNQSLINDARLNYEQQRTEGWNLYTYWVTSDAKTQVQNQRICVRAGKPGFYTNSCSSSDSEYAMVSTLPPKQRSTEVDFHKREVPISISSTAVNVKELKHIQFVPQNFTILDIRVDAPLGESQQGSYVGSFNTRWNTALWQDWNSNGALEFVYNKKLGSNGYYNGIKYYHEARYGWTSETRRMPGLNLNTNNINFIFGKGGIKDVGHYGNTEGAFFSNDINNSGYGDKKWEVSNGVIYTDNYGNENKIRINVDRNGGRFYFQ